MEARLETRSEIEVVYAFSMGPYSVSPGQAWQALSAWIDRKGAQQHITEVIGFGMDNPFTTPPPLIRYVAAFALSEGIEADRESNIHVMKIPGGRYAVHTMVGPYSQMPDRFQHFQQQWLPQSGHRLDYSRPFLEIYTKKMGEVPEAELETDICLPLLDGPCGE